MQTLSGNNPMRPQLPIWNTTPSQTNLLKLEVEWSPVGRSVCHRAGDQQSAALVQLSCGGCCRGCPSREKRATRDACGLPVDGALSRAGFNGGCGLRKLFAWSSGGGGLRGQWCCGQCRRVPWCRRVGQGNELVMLQPPPVPGFVSISGKGHVKHRKWLFWGTIFGWKSSRLKVENG